MGRIALDRRGITLRSITKCSMTADPVILIPSSLASGEKHGYAIMADIQAFSGVLLGAGTLYGAIRRLEERGWIRPVESDDRRRPYALTAPGLQHLKEEIGGLDRIVKAAQHRSSILAVGATATATNSKRCSKKRTAALGNSVT